MSEINENTTTIDPELLQVPEIREAIELAEQSAYSLAELDAYDAYWDAVSTEKSLISDKCEEAKVARSVEIAKNLLLNGLESSFIAKMTGLSETQIAEFECITEE
jgi:predicted transposase/invertase (TIGR01784 family)